jgi:hypothetical protein
MLQDAIAGRFGNRVARLFPVFGQCREKIEQTVFFRRKTRFAFAEKALDLGDDLIIFSFSGDNHRR